MPAHGGRQRIILKNPAAPASKTLQLSFATSQSNRFRRNNSLIAKRILLCRRGQGRW
jgi:hypothetical protein